MGISKGYGYRMKMTKTSPRKFPGVLNIVTEEHQKYLRKLIGISFGIGITDEVSDGLDLINRVLEDMKYHDDDIEQLNNLHIVFRYEEKKGKHYL